MILAGGGGVRCYLGACATFVRVGMLKFKDEVHTHPCIEVSYDLEALTPLSKLFHEMKKQMKNPEVYVWDEGKPEPEVAVIFRLQNPDLETVRIMGGKIGEMMQCSEVVATGEANTDQASLREFLAALSHEGQAALIVTDSTSTTDEDPATVSSFVITQIRHEKPSLFGL